MEIKPHYREGRRKPWEARWWVNRKLRSRFFASEKERDKFIREFRREIAQHGETIFQVDAELQREWVQVNAALPHVRPLQLAKFWLENHGKQIERLTFSQAIEAYFTEMQRADRDPDYQSHTMRTLKRFASHIGDRHLDDITASEIADFVYGLPFKAITKRHQRTYLVGAWKFFQRQGWTTVNPASAVPTPKVHLAEPGVLTIKETEALFRANETIDPEICGLLALGAFAGMRSSAICRLAWDELDFKNKAILTPAAKTKKGRRQFIEDLPDNLWDWLKRTPRQAFGMSPREFRHRREQAFVRAGLIVTKSQAKKDATRPKRPPKNALRHSFVSYHVALHRNPGKTALLISHKDQSILWDHYLGVATIEDAERYFAIQPTA